MANLTSTHSDHTEWTDDYAVKMLINDVTFYIPEWTRDSYIQNSVAQQGIGVALAHSGIPSEGWGVIGII